MDGYVDKIDKMARYIDTLIDIDTKDKYSCMQSLIKYLHGLIER